MRFRAILVERWGPLLYEGIQPSAIAHFFFPICVIYLRATVPLERTAQPNRTQNSREEFRPEPPRRAF